MIVPITAHICTISECGVCRNNIIPDSYNDGWPYSGRTLQLAGRSKRYGALWRYYGDRGIVAVPLTEFMEGSFAIENIDVENASVYHNHRFEALDLSPGGWKDFPNVGGCEGERCDEVIDTGGKQVVRGCRYSYSWSSRCGCLMSRCSGFEKICHVSLLRSKERPASSCSETRRGRRDTSPSDV